MHTVRKLDCKLDQNSSPNIESNSFRGLVQEWPCQGLLLNTQGWSDFFQTQEVYWKSTLEQYSSSLTKPRWLCTLPSCLGKDKPCNLSLQPGQSLFFWNTYMDEKLPYQTPNTNNASPRLSTLELDCFLHLFTKMLLFFLGCLTHRQVPVSSPMNKSGDTNGVAQHKPIFLTRKTKWNFPLSLFLGFLRQLSRTHLCMHRCMATHIVSGKRQLSCF